MFGSLFVILGEHNLNGNSENAKPIFRAVRRMIIHRQYNAATFENDLALLELSAPIQDEPNVMPICLPNRESDVFDEATVTGFGKLKYGNELLWPLCALYEHQFKCSLSLPTRKRRFDSEHTASGPTAHTGQQEVSGDVLGERSS